MNNLLLEIGTEELPPTKLLGLSNALKDEFNKQLTDKQLSFDKIIAYNSPRRLAIIVTNLATKQPDIQQLRRGPAKNVAFDRDNNPSQALLGFAKSCKVAVTDLTEIQTDKGIWMGVNVQTKGKSTQELIPKMFESALNKLPIAKRMRWGSSSFEFVRPVHWIVAVLNNKIIPITLFNINSNKYSYGHRFHHPQKISVNADNYLKSLEDVKVIVDFDKRQQLIIKQLKHIAQKLGGTVKLNKVLLDEVTSLVEFPVALAGKFDIKFLEIPSEAIVAFMEGHQKFFAIFDKNKKLLPYFITVSNIISKQPNKVIEGNQRVIYPRLTDALFFWQQDKNLNLNQQTKLLKTMVYQKDLGTVFDKVLRISKLSIYLADILNENKQNIEQAAYLSKTDLLSNMVTEFPKLQGTMGKYYAQHAGFKDEIALAIEEHYLPRYADDKLPSTKLGQIIAIADKIDTLVGIFATGHRPTGDKDPFGLRRAALGILRIILECNLTINLPKLLQKSAGLFDKKITIADDALAFILERFKGMGFVKKHLNMQNAPDVFQAISLNDNGSIVDFISREQAVSKFLIKNINKNLIQSNKRIANLLKNSPQMDDKINESLFVEPVEIQLYQALLDKQQATKPLVQKANYAKALEELSKLSPTIDNFFDNVMVMTDNQAVKNNRIALLAKVRNLFLQIVDLSKINL